MLADAQDRLEVAKDWEAFAKIYKEDAEKAMIDAQWKMENVTTNDEWELANAAIEDAQEWLDWAIEDFFAAQAEVEEAEFALGEAQEARDTANELFETGPVEWDDIEGKEDTRPEDWG